MNSMRTITFAKVIVDKASLGDVDPFEFVVKLESAILEMPDIDDNVETVVAMGNVSKYSGHYSDSETYLDEELAGRLRDVSEDVFAKIIKGK